MNGWRPGAHIGPYVLAEPLGAEEWARCLTGCLAAIFHLSGDETRAASLLATAAPDDTFGAPLVRFNYHAALGEFADAAIWLEKSIEQRDTRAPWILPNIYGPAFTASPYWPPLARKMNLPV